MDSSLCITKGVAICCGNGMQHKMCACLCVCQTCTACATRVRHVGNMQWGIVLYHQFR